jgi:hypothetical protein
MKQSANFRYQELTSGRTSFLDKARECSELTLPYLIPPSGSATHTKLKTPWQSVGAKGVNVMASKLLLSLIPPTGTFFKLQINDGEFIADEQLNAEIKSEVDLVLARSERIILQHINDSQDRVVLFTALKHLVVGGNVLLFMPEGKSMKMYPLTRYVADRDGNDEATEILTVESVNRKLLPKQFHQISTDKVNHTGADAGGIVSDTQVGKDEVAVFTCVKRKDNRWTWYQEADGVMIPGSEGAADHEVCPWMPLRFNVVDGENYGRGRIEEYLGDLRSLEGLIQAMVEGAAGLAKLLFLVSPGASIKPRTLAEAANLTVIPGREGDITTVQANKSQDYGPVLQMIGDLTKRLDEAFLVMNVRDSERTTAEEIRQTQQELNEQLGGNLGNLTRDLLQPYLKRKIFELKRKKQLPPLPKGLVFPAIITGLDGIGRGQDLEALTRFVTIGSESLGPEQMQANLHIPEYLKRLAAAAGIDTIGLIKTEEEIQAEQQQAQEAAQQQALTEQASDFAELEAEQQQQPTEM